MGVERHVVGHQLIGEGMSGSRAYRVSFGGHEAVLKVTDPEAPSWVLARARRELSFYLTLASHIPLRVPELLAGRDDDAVGICLFLATYAPTPPPAQWPADDAVEVARQLARLHASFWGSTGRLASYTWLRQPPARTGEEAISHARDEWRALGRSDHFRALFSTDTYLALDSGLERIPTLDAAIQVLPVTLYHGDCHVGNLLRDPQARFVWADWSEVGIQVGPTDLSFLIQRANAEGARFSIDELSAAYHNQLVEAIGQAISLDVIRRVMDAYELRARLLEWPYYLGWATAETVSDMLARIETLAARF
jgi:hypothetical protein